MQIVRRDQRDLGQAADQHATGEREDLVLRLEATRRLRTSVPEARVVILTMHGEESVIDQALRAQKSPAKKAAAKKKSGGKKAA